MDQLTKYKQVTGFVEKPKVIWFVPYLFVLARNSL
jgi:hypothetical protein